MELLGMKPSLPGSTPDYQQQILLAITPSFASLVYGGEKRYEFRRVRMAAASGANVHLYEVAPVRAVTGSFIVGEVIYGTPDELIGLEQDASVRRRIYNYLLGATFATALQIIEPRKFHTPLAISNYGLSRPPQSYIYLR